MLSMFKNIFGARNFPEQIAPGQATPSLSDMRFLFQRMSRSQCEDYIRRHTSTKPIDDSVILCKTLAKYDLYVLANDVGFGRHMAEDGYWEYWLTQFLVETIQPGDVVLDVGANHGYYSVLAADLAGPSGEVVCVEANPVLCKLVGMSLEANGYAARSRVLDIALTDHDTPIELPFFVPRNEPKNGTLLRPGQDMVALSARGDITKVTARALAMEELPKLDFVKIDVEGAEMSVLKGLMPILLAHRPKIIAEVNFGRGYTYMDLLNLFEGKASFRHLDTDATLKPVDEEMSWTQRINEDWLFFVDWPEANVAI